MDVFVGTQPDSKTKNVFTNPKNVFPTQKSLVFCPPKGQEGLVVSFFFGFKKLSAGFPVFFLGNQPEISELFVKHRTLSAFSFSPGFGEVFFPRF